MATIIPASSYIQKDIFGGPSGSTQQAMQQLITSILQGSEKRRLQQQRQDLANNFSEFTSTNPNSPPSDFISEILKNGQYKPEVVNNFVNTLGTQAQIEKLQTPTKKDTEIWAGKKGDNTSWIPIKYTGGETINEYRSKGYDLFRKTPPQDANITNRFRVVGNKLVDISGDDPEVVIESTTSSPSNLKKLITEREMLKSDGVPDDDPRIQAYDNKISGMDINIDEMNPDEIDVWGTWVNLTGRVPSVGRGKEATKTRIAILKSAAQQALNSQIPGSDPKSDKTPSEAALDAVTAQADTKSIQGSLNFLEKQLGAMGSFVTNLESQIDKVSSLSDDLKTYDTRLLNVPLRTLRGKITGSPLQAKYDMYLTEIESEIGKLATGSSASIAELSTTAQEKWDRIHDKNLSVADMLSLLEETKNAARLRRESVINQLKKTRDRMKTRDYNEENNDKSDRSPKFKILKVE